MRPTNGAGLPTLVNKKIAVEDLCGAVYALEKAQSPPDLVAELRKKLNAFNGDNAKEIDDLIAALSIFRDAIITESKDA